MTQTIEQFGQVIKTKYPQYADIPDVELGQKMLAKYPQYADMIQTGNVEKTDSFLSSHPILNGISDFVGTSGLGKGLAQGIFLKFTPEGKDLINQVAQGKISQDELANILGEPATTKEIIGSTIQTGANVLSAGIPTPKALLGTRAALGRIGQAAGTSAIAGSALGFGKELEQGGSVKEASKKGLETGAVSGFISFGIGGVVELAKLLSSQGVQKSIVNRTLGIKPKLIEQGRSPAPEVLEQGLGSIKTKQGIYNQSAAKIKSLGNKIKEILNEGVNVGKKADTSSILDSIRYNLWNIYGDTLSKGDVQKIIDNLPINAIRKNDSLTVKALNVIREVIDNKYLGNAKWLNNSSSESITALKVAANTLRGIVKASDNRLDPLFSSLSNNITIRNSVNSQLSKPHIMTNILEMLGSGLYGAATAGLSPEGIKNALIGFGILKTVLSTPAQMTTAQGLRITSKALTSKVGQEAIKGVGIVGQNIAKEIMKK